MNRWRHSASRLEACDRFRDNSSNTGRANGRGGEPRLVGDSNGGRRGWRVARPQGRVQQTQLTHGTARVGVFDLVALRRRRAQPGRRRCDPSTTWSALPRWHAAWAAAVEAERAAAVEAALVHRADRRCPRAGKKTFDRNFAKFPKFRIYR